MTKLVVKRWPKLCLNTFMYLPCASHVVLSSRFLLQDVQLALYSFPAYHLLFPFPVQCQTSLKILSNIVIPKLTRG